MGGTPRCRGGPGAPRPAGEPTFAVAAEPVGLDHVLLDLGSHGQQELQHLAHVVAGVVPSLLHALRVLGRPERLDHLRQHGCGTRALSRTPASRMQRRGRGPPPPARPGHGTARTHPSPAPRSAPAAPGAARRPPLGAAGRPRLRPHTDQHRLQPSPARARLRLPTPFCHCTACGSGFPRARETCWTNSKRAEITAGNCSRASSPSGPTHPEVRARAALLMDRFPCGSPTRCRPPAPLKADTCGPRCLQTRPPCLPDRMQIYRFSLARGAHAPPLPAVAGLRPSGTPFPMRCPLPASPTFHWECFGPSPPAPLQRNEHIRVPFLKGFFCLFFFLF